MKKKVSSEKERKLTVNLDPVWTHSEKKEKKKISRMPLCMI